MSSSIVWSSDGPNLVIEGDNLSFLSSLPNASIPLIYIDPPFNTGRKQTRQSLKTQRSESGSRLGFKGQSYETVKGVVTGYDDAFEDYWAFLEPRLEQAWRVLTDSGSLYLHLDYREVHPHLY